MKKIFITRRLPPVAKEILKKHFIVDENPENKPLSVEELREAVEIYDGILSTISDKFTEHVLNEKTKVEVISNYAVGLDNINIPLAKEKGIAVYNTPDVVTNSTADMTFALLFSLIRKIAPAQDFVRNNQWQSWDPELFLGEELAEKTLGIIGFGKIGKAVAMRALGFGLKVIYYSRSPHYPEVNNAEGNKIKHVPLDVLLQEADYISLHLPLTTETRHFINAVTISKMSRKPILLNLARGEIVETEALLAALKSGSLRGACLDVTSPEPLTGKHPLCHLENCIIVPHIGTATKECRYNMAKLAAENIVNYFNMKIRK